jgi:DNA end-binding protein Ku
MRSIWKGSISFGLVNVPVKVYSATEEQTVKFHQVHLHDHGRIRYQRVCEQCGQVVSFSDIDKAYEFEDGEMTVVTAQDLEDLPAERSREIEVLTFVPVTELDPTAYDRSYFLAPENKSATKSYGLLSHALQSTDRLAICNLTLRSRTRLGALRVRQFQDQQVMMVHTLLWPDECRQPEFPLLARPPQLSDQELTMAQMLVDTMSADAFDPSQHTDTYRQQVLELVAAKRDNTDLVRQLPAAPPDDEVADLLAKLTASVAARAVQP